MDVHVMISDPLKYAPVFIKAGADIYTFHYEAVENIEKIKETYNPKEYYQNDNRIKRCLDALIDGTLSDGGTGVFKELYDAILEGASWHKPDHYYLLLDFADFLETKIKLNLDCTDRLAFAKKQWLNMCSAGEFSSDRTIKEYAKDIWKIKS